MKYSHYSQVIAKTLQKHEIKFDVRKRRFDYLLAKWEENIGINDEQAEAYKLRLDHHEKKLEEEIVHITKLREIFLKMSKGLV